MNVFESAMNMELDGKEYYEKLMELTEDNGLKKIFEMLAEDEERHNKILSKMQNGCDIEIKSEILRKANNIFANMLFSENNYNVDIEHIKDYKYACDLEEKSIKFYEERFNKARNEKEKEILKRLFEEEKKHKLILENVIEFIDVE